MCGIVGAAARRDIVPVLVEGLRRLEYRGYDSAGIAVLDDAKLKRLRAAGQTPEGPSRFCHACFSGDYPTPVPGELVQLSHSAPLAGAGR